MPLTDAEIVQLKADAAVCVQNILPPVPVLKLSRKQEKFLGEFLKDEDLPAAMARSRCSLKDVSNGYQKWLHYQERLSFRRIAALAQLGRFIGMSGHARISPPEDPETVAKLLETVVLPDITSPQRYAVSLLLDYYDPDWHSRLSLSELGMVVSRDDLEVIAWRKAVLKRDGRACQQCGGKTKLHVHHIAGWAKHPALRVVVSNGVTLCEDCHKRKHMTN